VGDDERLKDNIHGIVVFKHNGESRIAVAQNVEQRVLILGACAPACGHLEIEIYSSADATMPLCILM
jgi:uncharacterized protein YbbK (DUF523 family)